MVLFLGTIGVLLGTWAIGGTAIKGAVTKLFDGLKKMFGGDPDGGGGGGSTDPETEEPAIQWNLIGGRPFAITSAIPALGSVLGGNAGFTGDITVSNKTPLGAGNALYVMNYDNFSMNPITGNVIFDTAAFTSADKTLLIDFNDRIFRAKNIKVEAKISFYDENASIVTNPSGFVPVLELNSTNHGEWRFTKNGVFHKNSAVVTYSTAQDRYIFHGIVTNGAPTPASDYETGTTQPSVMARARRLFTRNTGNEITPADSLGNQIRQSGSQQAQRIQALEIQADQLQTQNNALVSQAAKVRRVALQAKVKKGIQGFFSRGKKQFNKFRESLPSGVAEGAAQARGAVQQAVLRGKTIINKTAGKGIDGAFKSLLP